MLDQLQVITIPPFPYHPSVSDDEPLIDPNGVVIAPPAYKLLPLSGMQWTVSAAVEDGFSTARKAYAEMEEESENGAYMLLTGYEYAHLARTYLPSNIINPIEKQDWQRGFILGWVACILLP